MADILAQATQQHDQTLAELTEWCEQHRGCCARDVLMQIFVMTRLPGMDMIGRFAMLGLAEAYLAMERKNRGEDET